MRTILWIFAVNAAVLAADPVWEELPAKPDLPGWKVAGAGEWRAVGEVVVGRCPAGEKGWLVLERPLADFELAGELMAGSGDSGLLLRTSQFKDGRLVGADVPCGRGLEPRVWHQLYLRYDGQTLTVEVDGKTSRSEHSEARHGPPALALGGGDFGGEVRWRKLRVRDLGWGAGWNSLFNGADLTGWKAHGKEKWTAENGEIVGQAVTDAYGYLATEKTYQDFECRIEFRCIDDGNRGLFFHSKLNGVDILGVQGEIDPHVGGHSAGLYEAGGRGWIALPTADGEAIFRPGEWNEMVVRCEGNRTTTWLNGMRTVDLVDDKHRFTDGVLALQLHSGGHAGVHWRNLWVRGVPGG
ncbi:MAG: DUF1080 domain-containing protein [Armatimonadetes bacterium]|nr:DUF1080 domain-containing protein [Armatimonadota bacterium]